jgi:CheY-like chemotaxis protein
MRTRKGSGLGLAIIRNFVQILGGSIEVESESGRGSRFHVHLPVERAEGSELVSETLQKAQVAGLEPGQPDYRILIVEDEMENRLLLERLLRKAGFKVRGAGDGVQAVEAFRIWQPHFIWMDLRLPVLDGLEAAKRIRELHGGREVKIASVTASIFASQREEVLAVGLDDSLRKPFRPWEIFDCMARHLGVRYVYRDQAQAAAVDRPAALRPEDLAALPADLRNELQKAVVSCDREQIEPLVRQISDQNASLGGVLAHLVTLGAFTPIFNVLESCNKRVAQGGA